MSASDPRLDGFRITTKREEIDQEAVYRYLSETSYWAQGRAREVVAASMEGSLCFGVIDRAGATVGFARVVTDRATFGWVCDLFIVDACQGRGLGTWLVESIVSDPVLERVKRLMLATRDAHELYRRHGGFSSVEPSQRWMERVLP
jgi:GNAT superfamily N-acetyltransferase